MPTIEKISAREKAALSRETILAWYRSQNKEKLENLKDEIKELAFSDREKLRAIIIENTKRELEKQKQLTARQRDLHAKQFADEFIKAIMGKESVDAVIKRYEKLAQTGGREALAQKYVNNNPNKKIEIVEDDPKYLALRNISEPRVRTEVCVLLGLISKIKGMGGKKKALELFNSCMEKDSFNLKKLRAYFSRESTEGKLGFYYGERKITWKPTQSIWKKIRAASLVRAIKDWEWEILDGNIYSGYKKTFRAVGWWAHDIDDKDSSGKIIGGRAVEINGGETPNDLIKKLREGSGYGDEWLGKNFADAIPGVRKELIGTKKIAKDANRDSGLDAGDEQKVRDSINESEDLSKDVYKEKAAEEMYKWLSINASNKWVKLEEKELGLMTFLFGAGCGNYLYRYSSKKNEVYAVRIDGANVPAEQFGGLISVKNNKALDNWESYDRANTEKMCTYITDSLSSEEINKELLDYKIAEEKPENITTDDQLEKTKGLVFALFGVKNVEYENIEKDYLGKLLEKLKEDLEKKGLKKEKAEDFAEHRISYLKSEIYKIIEADEVMSKAKEADPKVKFEIKVDANDEVTIKLAEVSLAKSIKGKLKEKADKKLSPEALEGNYMKQLEAKVSKWAGRFTPFVMLFLEKFFKVSDKVKELVKGTPSLFTAIAGFFGLKTGKDILSIKRINEKAFEKLPPANKKSYSLTRKMVFDGDVSLKNKRIIIPKGKGLIPGGKIKLKLDSRYAVEYDPANEKKEPTRAKPDIRDLYKRLKREKEKYKEYEITIEAGTVVPGKTEIPKGARIERV